MSGKDKAETQKATVLDDVARARTAILEAVNALPAGKRREVFLGVWSSYELVAHLIGWDYANIQAIDDILAGQLPHFYAHRDPDWRTYNAHLVSQHSKESWDELMAAVAESHERLMSVVRSLPAGELYRDRGLRFRGYKVMIGRLLEADVKDCMTHAAQVMAFKDQIKLSEQMSTQLQHRAAD